MHSHQYYCPALHACLNALYQKRMQVDQVICHIPIYIIIVDYAWELNVAIQNHTSPWLTNSQGSSYNTDMKPGDPGLLNISSRSFTVQSCGKGSRSLTDIAISRDLILYSYSYVCSSGYIAEPTAWVRYANLETYCCS